MAVFSEELSSWDGLFCISQWRDRFPPNATTHSSPVPVSSPIRPAAQTLSPVPVATQTAIPRPKPWRRLQLQSQPFQLQPQPQPPADGAKKSLARKYFLQKDRRPPPKRDAKRDDLGRNSSVSTTTSISSQMRGLSPLSAATRRATAQIAEHVAQQAAENARYEAEIDRQREAAAEAARRAAEEAARFEEEKALRLAMAQEEAKTRVQSYMRSFLSRGPSSDEELSAAFLTCTEDCKTVGLDFATVLQEPLIGEQPPIYWAIINAPLYGTNRAYDSFVFALLGASQPLSSSTFVAVRIACMMTSDNTLLQRLFRHVPELSSLSPSDAMLLAPLNESDVVEVMETRDGTGTFVAHIRILRFRLRMRVSKCVAVEFVTSGALLLCVFKRYLTQFHEDRIWTLRFAVVVETSTEGRSESKWLLSLELGEHSQVVAVDADLFIEGSASRPLDSRDFDDPLFCVSFGSTKSELWPGHENGITVRLDDGPMGPHLLNEYVKTRCFFVPSTDRFTCRSPVLVNSNGTLCARLNARLAQPALPLVSDTPSTISPPLSLEVPFSKISYPPSVPEAKKRPKDPKVYTPLRRGNR